MDGQVVWMNGSIDGWMDEWTDEWMDKSIMKCVTEKKLTQPSFNVAVQ